MAKLAGTDDNKVLARLADAFKLIYDDNGYQEIAAFPLVEDMLDLLITKGYTLYIATNKREMPTGRILAFLGWKKYFMGVYSLNSFSPAMRSKADLIHKILTIHSLGSHSVTYIRDRNGDGEAATENAIDFLLAGWGSRVRQLMR